MRRHGFVLLGILAVAAVAATAAQAHSTPKIRAERARQRAVLAEYNRIGRNLEKVVQAYDGAKYRLEQVDQSLQQNEHKLGVARHNLQVAKQRLMARLVNLYVSGRPSTIEVIAGATSISELIDRIESARVLSNQDAALGREALHFARAVQRREQQLRQLKRTRAKEFAHLASRKRVIESTLARQKRLLASIHTTIQQLQAKEAAREAKLKRELQARLARQIAEQRAAQVQQASTSTSTATATATPGVISSPVTVPIGNGGVGHPEAAQIALRYLGVPYVWGGASPGGFDCSGLVMYVYAQLGISLPHYTVEQWNVTVPITTSQLLPGDLLFFDGLGHVGIYIGNGQFIDAPHTGTVVRIDSLSTWGGTFDGARRVP